MPKDHTIGQHYLLSLDSLEMADGPYSCYLELISATAVVGAEFFQVFNHFRAASEDFLCCLTSSTISIYRVVRNDEGEDLEFEDSSLELVYQRRVFGHLKCVKRYRLGPGRSDLLFIAIDSGKVVMFEYNAIQNNLLESILCNLELGNDNVVFDGKQQYLGHGKRPIIVVNEEYKSIAVSVYGEHIFACKIDHNEVYAGSITGIIAKKLLLRVPTDIGLIGPVLDIAFVNGYSNPTCAILQQEHILNIGHASKVTNTCSVAVVALNFDSNSAAIIWRANSMPHDCLRLVSFKDKALPTAVMIISQNAVLVAHQESISAIPTNGFAAVTVGNNPKVIMKPWTTYDRGLELSNSHWVQYGSNHASEGSFVGFLRDGTVVLLHLSYYAPKLPSTLDMELVIHREGFSASYCCISSSKPELLFTSSREGTSALFRIGYSGFVKHSERDREEVLYDHSFVHIPSSSNAGESKDDGRDFNEESLLYGSGGLQIDKISSNQWIVDIKLLDVLTNLGPVLCGNIIRNDDVFSQIDHIRWNRGSAVSINSQSNAAAFIPEREQKDSLIISSSRDKHSTLNRYFSGLAYSKSATKSFPGGRTMFSFHIFDKSIILLSFSNKSKVLQCEKVAIGASSKNDSNVRFHEWVGEDSGFVVGSKTLFVGVIHQTEEEAIILQVTPTMMRSVKIRRSTFDTEPLQDMSLHESHDIGGLGGRIDEVIITADSTPTTGHIALVTSHLRSYFIHYNAVDESMELAFIHSAGDMEGQGDDGFVCPGFEYIIKSPIVSSSTFEANLYLPEVDWQTAIQNRHQTEKQTYSAVELEEIMLYGHTLSDSNLTASCENATAEAASLSANAKSTAITPISLRSSENLVLDSNFSSAKSYVVLTEKNGFLSIFELPSMTCILHTLEVSRQSDTIPLRNEQSSSFTSTATSKTFNDDSFIVETRVFAVGEASGTIGIDSASKLYLAVVFSSGEFLLYHFQTIDGVAVSLNRLLTYTLHTRRYPGVPFVRGINNSDAAEIPGVFMNSNDAEYICRMPPIVHVLRGQKPGDDGHSTKIFLASHDPQLLTFDRGYPLLLSLDFPETPLVNFGYCTVIPLFPDDTSLVATLWYEYEDLDTTTETTKHHRIKNKPMKQSTFGIYRQLPRQMLRAGMQGAVQAVSVDKTVHKCLEINKITDNKTEQALLDKRTYVLLCSQKVFKPFNPDVIPDPEAEMENSSVERYFPSLASFQQPNTQLAPNPLTVTKEYRVCLLQHGKVVDNFVIEEKERVLDATVLYLTQERTVQSTAPPANHGHHHHHHHQQQQPQTIKTYEKRVFVLVSTLENDSRAEDTQGNGRMLLLSLDYAMFEEEEGKANGKSSAQSEEKGVDGSTDPASENALTDENGSANNGNGTNGESKPAEVKAGIVNGKGLSKAQQQFLGSIQPKLRSVWSGPGPASIVQQFPAFPNSSTDPNPSPWSNYVLATVGSIIYVYKFNSDTLELDQVAFFFAQVGCSMYSSY